MNKKNVVAFLLAIVVVTSIVPVAFFSVPPRASAGAVGAASCIGAFFGGVSLGATGTMVPVVDAPNLAPNTGSCVEEAILMPIARFIARWLLQEITAATIDWINGGNGTGQTSFVQNLAAHLQSVADTIAHSFIANLAVNINSPFGLPISISLSNTYTRGSSMKGFFSSNKCTLSVTSPDPFGFLSGNWSQGGAGAWLGLTTQDQNNPYTLYPRAQAQLAINIGEAQTNRRQDLQQGSGFLSWCPGDSEYLYSNDGSINSLGTNNVLGVSAKTPCYDSKTGKALPASTPGSVIHDYTQKVVVSTGMDSLITAQDLDASLNAIINALVTRVLNEGLATLSSPGGTDNNTWQSFMNTQQAGDTDNGAMAAATQNAQAFIENTNAFSTAWQTIHGAAESAQTAVTSLKQTCSTNATNATTLGASAIVCNNAGNCTTKEFPALITPATFVSAAQAEASAAQRALADSATIGSILAQADTALGVTVPKALELANRVLDGMSSVGDVSQVSNDIQALMSSPPSSTDVQNAQQNAKKTNQATANPPGSLTVSGGTYVDQLNLIEKNALILQGTVCNPEDPAYPAFTF